MDRARRHPDDDEVPHYESRREDAGLVARAFSTERVEEAGARLTSDNAQLARLNEGPAGRKAASLTLCPLERIPVDDLRH